MVTLLTRLTSDKDKMFAMEASLYHTGPQVLKIANHVRVLIPAIRDSTQSMRSMLHILQHVLVAENRNSGL